MKILSILFVLSLLSFEAIASNICHFANSVQFEQAVEGRKITLLRENSHPAKFTRFEKFMAFRMIQETSDLRVSYKEALELFNEKSSDGEIAYYKLGKQTVTRVRYWPGDTQAGAFFSVNRGSKPKILAIITDGDIYCQ